jgi:hypothetical protein
MADIDTPYPHERLNAHAMLERVEQFFQRIDQDRAARTKETGAVLRSHGVFGRRG